MANDARAAGSPVTHEHPLVIVEARTDVVAPAVLGASLAGRPVLRLLLDRLAALDGHVGARTVVTTSDRPVDDEVAALAQEAGVPVVRGQAGDAVGWASLAMVRHGGPGPIVRVGADGPLQDPYLVAAALDLHRSARADHTSNLLPRTHPDGLTVEVLSPAALRAAELEVEPAPVRDLTSHLVRRPERFRLASLHDRHDASEERWRVRTDAERAQLDAALAQVPNAATASWNRILSVIGRTRRTRPGEVHLRPLEPPAPGEPTWTRRWDAVVDGAVVGQAEVTVGDGRTTRDVIAIEPWREPIRDALYRLLLDDPQAGA